MGFWIFMLIFELLIPFTMIGFGRYFMKSSPKDINALFGYRTTMSMKNTDTWDFAHRYCGKIWYISGLVLLPVAIILMLSVIGRDSETIGKLGMVLCFVQMIPLVGVIIPTEAALKKNFDKNGRRRPDAN